MKNLMAVFALLALVGTVLLTGCQKEETPAPTPPATNAPATE